MRKITNLAAIVIAVFAMVFTSCTPDPVNPTITVTQETTGEIVQGQKVIFNITVSADTEAESSLSQFTISKAGMLIDTDGKFVTAGDGSLFSFAEGVTSASFKFEYTVPANAVPTEAIELKFTVQDSEALMMDNTQTIAVFAAKPTITVTKISTNASAPGEAVKYQIVVASASSATLKNIAVVANDVDGNPIAGIDGTGVDNTDGLFEIDTKNFVAETKTATFNYTYVISGNRNLDEKLTLTFTITNNGDYKETAEQEIIVKAIPLTVLPEKTLKYNSASLDAQSQYSTVGGLVTSANVTAKPDETVSDFAFQLVYINSGVDKQFSILSPNVLTYSNGLVYSSNTVTKLAKSTKTFEEITPEYLQTLVVDDTYSVLGIADGDILVFETMAGKRGVIKITTPAQVVKGTEATVTINVKVQE